MKPALNDNGLAQTMFDHPAHERQWWEGARDRLEWRPIADYDTGNELALAEPVILRNGHLWVYGSWSDGVWMKVTEGGSWSLGNFTPTEWAEVALDEAIMLGQG